jgi:hypothetical protein
MSDLVKKNIEKAAEDLKKENEQKAQQMVKICHQ